MTTLRSALIRLAHQNPEIRPHLLPLIRCAADDNPYGLYDSPKQEAATEDLADEIATIAVAVASSYKRMQSLIKKYDALGAGDSDSRDAIWGDWKDGVTKGMKGKTASDDGEDYAKMDVSELLKVLDRIPGRKAKDYYTALRSTKKVREAVLDTLAKFRPQTKTAVGQYMEVKNLPPSLQGALREVRYGRKDIKVEAATTYSVQGGGGAGQRAFAVAVDLVSGQTKVLKGSWGGSNPFEAKQVDRDDTSYPLPHNGAVVVGVEGGGHPVYATVYVNPANLQALLPSGLDEELPEGEIKALQIIKSMKPGYRAQYFADHGLGAYNATNPVLLSLVKKGLVKATGAGIQITTAGKSLAESSKRLIY